VAVAEPAVSGRGRPRLAAVAGLGTRDRLLAAASATCVERGYEGATVGEIARRAGVTTGAIYNHFGGRTELLVEAGRRALDEVTDTRRLSVHGAVRRFLSAEFARTRRLLLELHSASHRHADVAALLDDWHAERAAELEGAGADPVAVTALFLLLLGCCQVDAVSALGAASSDVEAAMLGAVDALAPWEGRG
jgi:AcrR family transcriptional regulator